MGRAGVSLNVGQYRSWLINFEGNINIDQFIVEQTSFDGRVYVEIHTHRGRAGGVNGETESDARFRIGETRTFSSAVRGFQTPP